MEADGAGLTTEETAARPALPVELSLSALPAQSAHAETLWRDCCGAH